MTLSSREARGSEGAEFGRNTNVTEARVVGMFAWAAMMLKEANMLLDHGNREAYLTHREKVESKLNMLADDMELPMNNTAEKKIIQERWLQEEEKVMLEIQELDAKAKKLL